MAVTTRERIVDVAMELFGRQGFKATSIAPTAVQWLADRFAGRPAPSTC